MKLGQVMVLVVFMSSTSVAAAPKTSGAAFAINTPDFSVTEAAVSNDGKYVALTGSTPANARFAKVIIWNAESGEIHKDIRVQDASKNTTAYPAFSPNGELLLFATNNSDDEYYLLNVKSGKIAAKIKGVDGIGDFSPDGQLIRFSYSIYSLNDGLLPKNSDLKFGRIQGWTADGKLAMDIGRKDGGALQIVDPIGGTKAVTIQDEDRYFDGWKLLGDRETILTVIKRNKKEYFQFYSVADGKLMRQLIAPQPKYNAYTGWTMDMIHLVEASPDLMLERDMHSSRSGQMSLLGSRGFKDHVFMRMQKSGEIKLNRETDGGDRNRNCISKAKGNRLLMTVNDYSKGPRGFRQNALYLFVADRTNLTTIAKVDLFSTAKRHSPSITQAIAQDRLFVVSQRGNTVFAKLQCYSGHHGSYVSVIALQR